MFTFDNFGEYSIIIIYKKKKHVEAIIFSLTHYLDY